MFKKNLNGIFTIIIIAIIISIFGGCGPKKPVETPVEPTPTPKPTEILPTPIPKDEALIIETIPESLPLAELAKKVQGELKRVNFDYDKYSITPKGKEILIHNSEILKKYTQINVTIEGHCDERGSIEYNLNLGEKRANSVLEYLLLLGITSDRLRVVSFGEEKPLVLGQNEYAWAQNRRAEFQVRGN